MVFMVAARRGGTQEGDGDMKKAILSISFVLLLSFTPIRAEIIKIGLTGLVDSVTDPYNLLENGIHQNDSITGFYVYDSTTPDTNPLPIYGTYLYASTPYGISLTITSVTFQTDPLNVNFLVSIANDNQGNDSYSIISYNNLTLANGVTVDNLSWDLVDNLGIAISTTDLPVTPPDLSKWPFNNLYIFGGVGGTPPCFDEAFHIQGHITSAYLIPEPATFFLPALGGLLLKTARK
jgi:hypothetical protein